MKILKTLLLAILGLSLSQTAVAEPTSFSNAKKTLATKIYTDKDETFYCGCDMYYADKKGKPWLTPSHKACGFKPRKQEKRAARIEWEHIVPAWYFGHQRMCWQEGGRKKCRKDPVFKKMEANLHNLVPAIGEVNGDRSNFSLTMVSSNIAPQYGQCDMVVDFKARKAQPTEEIRGDIARTYFYMADKYKLRLSNQDLKLYTVWNNSDPVSREELRIHNLKAKYQGEENPYVTGKKSPKDFKNPKSNAEIVYDSFKESDLESYLSNEDKKTLNKMKSEFLKVLNPS
jgi:deoxyribonuclease-1